MELHTHNPINAGIIMLKTLIILVSLRIGVAKNVTANFVFGDSLVEAGNNNYITSLSKANFFPNGIDFGKPTGRYTNGRTIIDVIGQEVGFPNFSPPYLAPTTIGPVVLQGVNYASGGSGVLNQSGMIFGGRINLGAQIDNFANTKARYNLRHRCFSCNEYVLERLIFQSQLAQTISSTIT